jgi:hypothetical protein
MTDTIDNEQRFDPAELVKASWHVEQHLTDLLQHASKPIIE